MPRNACEPVRLGFGAQKLVIESWAVQRPIPLQPYATLGFPHDL